MAEVALRAWHPVELHATDTYLVPADGSKGGPGGNAGTLLLVPGTRIRERTAEFDVEIRVNSHGLREREIPYEKPPGTYRVLVLGDSQTFGVGVEADETYSRLLERLLAESSGRRVEVINTGVPGTGTAHQLYYLEREGWKYSPDAVVVGYFFNDVNNNWLCHLYSVRDGRVERSAGTELDRGGEVWKHSRRQTGLIAYHDADRRPPDPPFWVRHSHLARLVRQSVSNLKHRSDPARRAVRKTEGRSLTSSLLAEINRQCRERNTACLVAMIPALHELKFRKPADLSASNRDLVSRLPAEQVLDLVSAFRAESYRQLFYPVDKHLTAAGHRTVARVLAERLRDLEPELR